MTESIQKKLLRVRPPRVRITYDVETGGAIEKKELPFIVGIFADLKGDREDPATYNALKTRSMADIDRDNFNDLMNTIKPRVSLVPAKHSDSSLSALLTDAGDNALVFTTIDDFEPLNVVQALPSLNKLYMARSQIRGLQAKAESDDRIAERLDALIQDKSPAEKARHLRNLQAPVALLPAEKPVLRQKVIGLQSALLGTDDAAATTALQGFSLLAPTTTAADLPQGKAYGTLLANALAEPDTLGNRGNAMALVTTLQAAAAAKPAATPDPTLASLGYDAASAKASLGKIVLTDLTAGIDKPTGDPLWALPLLLLGLTSDFSKEPAREDARNATLSFVKYLTTPPTAPVTAEDVQLAAQDLFPLIQTDTAKAILSLQYFSDQIRLVVDAASTFTDFDLSQAQIKGATAVIDELVAKIDGQLSDALSTIMHSPAFKQVEATWRGLQYLVFNTETSPMLKLRVLNATKDELRKDMQKAVEFDQSMLFKKIYEDEYGTYGGFPYSLLVGDYAIGGGNDDIQFLTKISEVAAAAHAPFIAQASQELFGLTGFDSLGKPRDLKKIFEGVELAGWREFRDMEDARYVALTLPRALLRLPYGAPEKRNTIQCEGINFEERVGTPAAPVLGINGISYPSPENDNFLWGNPAYLLAERITNAFSLFNWTAAIRGVEGGGLIEGLPRYTYTSAAGSTELFCPTEVSITDRREKELNDLGFISLCHCKGTGTAAFFGGQTTNMPKKYFSDDANANARISAMLPYMLAASRFAHYIKVIMREKIGSFLTRANVESYLNTWISNYVLLDDNATQEVKSSYPLRSAKVVVTDIPGEPGSYRATVFLKPHFQLEELTTSIRLVAQLPK